jgi:radical SAM protein with 4Fe4S-binding SPASM domain
MGVNMGILRFLPNPIFINIYLTNECNLRCKHCIDNSGYLTDEEKCNELSNQEIVYLLDYYIDRGVRNFSFSGGEPLLRKEIYDFISHIKKKNADVEVTIITNGTLIDKNVAEKLADLKVNYVRVSVESHNPKIHDWIRGTGNFDRVMNGLKNLLTTNISKIGVSITVNKENIKQIDDTVSFLYNMGLRHITMAPLMPAGRGENMREYLLSRDDFKKLLSKKCAYESKYPDVIFTLDTPLLAILSKDNAEALEKYGPCVIGSCFLGFKSNGDVYACPMRDEVIIGNLRKDNLDDLWNHSPLLNQIRNLKLLKGKCKSCKLLNYCGGGCRAYTHIVHNDFCEPDPFCWL